MIAKKCGGVGICSKLLLLLIPGLVVPGLVGEALAQQVSGIGAVSRYQGHGLRLEIQALAGDQVRAFMLARGFSASDADLVVQKGCIFRSNIGNLEKSAAAPVVKISLENWDIRPEKPAGAGVTHPLTRQKWAAIWAARKVPEGAKIAFHWGLFPSHQSHAPADYNWGFLSFGLAPQTRFDLTLRWQAGGKTFTHLFKGLTCGS